MSRPRRVRRLTAIGVASLTALLSSCMLWGTDQLGVSAGKGLYVRIYQEPTDQIEYLYIARGRNAATVLRDMETRVVFEDTIVQRVAHYGYYIADLDYFFDPVQRGDFAEALANVRGTNRCLMMHRNPGNILPWADRHNWTYSVPPGECRVGKPFPITA